MAMKVEGGVGGIFVVLNMQVNGAKTFKESPRVSFSSCRVSSLLLDQISRKSISYNKLPQEPIKLTVLKLDGNCFEIYVARNGTVAELKKAVEAAFSHLPKNGPETVSWSHVWGNFCLSYDGEKLLADSDSIRDYGIKDGDQLEFVRHVSISYPVKMTSEKEETNLDESNKHSKRDGFHYISFNRSEGIRDRKLKCKEDNNHQGKLEYHRVDTEKDGKDGVIVTNTCELRSVHLLRKWFSFHIFSRSWTRKTGRGGGGEVFGGRSNTWRLADRILGRSGKVRFQNMILKE